MTDLPPVLSEPIATFRPGAVLSRGFKIFFSGFPSFFVISAIAHLPIIAYMAWLSTKTLTLEDVKTWEKVLQYGGFPCAQLAAAAILYGTIQRLRGQPASFTESIAVGLRRMLPVIGVAIIYGIALGIGFLLLVIPGVFVFLTYFVAVPVAVIERPGVMASLNRSAELTKGYRGDLFAVALVYFLFTGASLLALWAYGKSSVESAVAAGSDPWVTVKINMFISLAVGIVLSVLNAVFAGVAYNDLRAVKDGANTDDLARVFE